MLTSLTAAGHDAVLVGEPDGLARELAGAEVLVVDLTADVAERLAVVRGVMARPGLRTLAFYSHVEADVRAQAERAGFDRVVPRSRMAREGAQLVERLSG